jgi:hypothetical protein
MMKQKSFWIGVIILSLFLIGTACEEDIPRLNNYVVQIDAFKQNSQPIVDILWVVDNSGTMRPEREELGQKFEKFLNRLLESGADYHIGVITTDMGDPQYAGKLQGFPAIITNQTDNPDLVFAANVELAETPNPKEKGLEAMRLALSEDMLDGGINDGFIREEAALFVIVVSDEDDQSKGEVRYYARWLEHIKGKGNENIVSFSAITGPQPDGCPDAKVGTRYLEVQEQTGGLAYSICAQDFGPVVDELGMNASGMKRKFYLSGVPYDETIEVLLYLEGALECTVNDDCGQEMICASRNKCATRLKKYDDNNQEVIWTYDDGDSSVFFPNTYLPPANSEIDVVYRWRIQ